MRNQLEKAMKIAGRTGDKIIVYDINRPESTYVVMTIDEYEKIISTTRKISDLTEDELLDKINRDIAVWKNDNIPPTAGTNQDGNFFPSIKDFKAKTEPYYSEEINNFEDFSLTQQSQEEKKSEQEKERKSRNHWIIPEDRKEGAEEIIEEDRHYLEEI